MASVNFITLRTAKAAAENSIGNSFTYFHISGSAAASRQVLELLVPRLPLPGCDPAHAGLHLPDPFLCAPDRLPGPPDLGGGVQGGRDPQDAPETLSSGHPYSGPST